MTTGKKEAVKFERKIPDFSARFQINKKAYVCGGERKINGAFESISDFFSFNY